MVYVLIDTLAYNTYINAFNANLVANESFLDSATIRENVVSLARNIGYVPRSKTAAVATTKLDAKPKQAWTDIAHFYEAKIASLNFGPGDPLLAHTSDERISKKQLVESYELLIRYLKGI